MSGQQCSLFGEGCDMEDWTPCHCPKCGGFLPADLCGYPLEEGKQFQCKRCNAVLELIFNEETGETGRICLVPPDAIKISVTDYKALREQNPRNSIQATTKWALGVGFSRRVWRNGDQEYITVDGEQINLDDPRILLVTIKSKGERVK